MAYLITDRPLLSAKSPSRPGFLTDRAAEWEPFWRDRGGEVLTALDLRTTMDWLQHRLANHTERAPVLALPAAHGRTRRVRRTAADRFRPPPA